MFLEMAQKVIVPKKKIMSQIFLISGTLVILCLIATMGPQFYSLIQAIIRKMQLLLQSHMLEEGNKVLFSRLASFEVVADGEGFEIPPDLAV
jgi:hypothetical protein